MRGVDNIILAIYNKFKYSLFYEMKKHKLERCMFYDYKEYHPDHGRFYFQSNALGDNSICSIVIGVDKFGYGYYDKLVDVFKSHVGWLFEIGEYDCSKDTFDILFKRHIYGGELKVDTYSIGSDGIITRLRASDYYDHILNETYAKIANYCDTDARSVYEAYEHSISVNKIRNQLPTFKFDSPFGGSTPKLSKPPIFNPPATICYWTDGTRTVVKCQEGDTYSKEAGLALCYMKKILGNTSRDLNKELHKYIPEENEEE